MFPRVILISLLLAGSGQAADILQPGIWDFIDKSQGRAKKVQILMSEPLTVNKYNVVAVSDPSALDVAGVIMNDKKILTLLIRKKNSKGKGYGFIHRYFSVIKAEDNKISLGGSTYAKDKEGSGGSILPDTSLGEVATLTRE